MFTHYAKYGVYALPAGLAAALLGAPAAIGIPLCLIGAASAVLLYRDRPLFK